MSIFRAYDIRGLFPSDIDPDTAYKIGLAYSRFLKPKKVVVGMDLRKSSRCIHDMFVKALLDSGVDVTSIGACTTPMLYFAGFNYEFDGAAMVTASHLPGKYNGLKLCREKAIPLSGPAGIYKIGKMVETITPVLAKRKGTLTRRSIKKDYHSFLTKCAKKTKLKVIVDCGNGMGFLDVEFLRKVADVTVLYEKPDLTFPNHIADPIKAEARTMISRRMRSGKFDLGIVFDGDCDRIGFLDERGTHVPMDHVTGILGTYLLEKSGKREKMIYDVRSTLAVPQFIRGLGSMGVMSKAGHSFMKQKMIKYDALFGGEKSGHYFFRDFGYADNAVLAALTMLNLISESGREVSELAAPFSKYVQIVETNFKVKDKDAVLKEIHSRFAENAKRIIRLDGISIYLDDGWFNVRKSNTENVIRLNAEADTRTGLDRIVKEVKRVIKG